MSALVIDASVAMAWCFGDEATPATAAVQDRLELETAVVPAHWFLEVANVLAMAEKRQRLRAEAASQFLSLLGVLDIEVDGEPASRAFTHVLPLCRTHGLTAYDAAYLELSVRRGLPLATLDAALRRAAGPLGVELLGV